MPGKESAPCKLCTATSQPGQHILDHNNSPNRSDPLVEYCYNENLILAPIIFINTQMQKTDNEVTMHKKITSPQHMEFKTANPGIGLAETKSPGLGLHVCMRNFFFKTKNGIESLFSDNGCKYFLKSKISIKKLKIKGNITIQFNST